MTKNTCLLLLALVAGGSTLFAQQKPKAGDVSKFASTITATELQQHLFTVAGPEMEGRNTPSRGLEKAAVYIADHFKSLGLAPVGANGYQMPYMLYTDSLTSTHLEINGKKLEEGKDFTMSMSNYSFAMNVGEIVFAGYGISDSTHNDYDGLNVLGKVVLVLSGTPTPPAGAGRRMGFINKQAIAAQHGAAAVIQVQANLSPSFRAMGGNRPYLDLYKKSLAPNMCTIRGEVGTQLTGLSLEALTEAAKSGKIGQTYPVRLSMGMEKTTSQIPTANVVGFMEGGDLKDEVLVITAHYDHVGITGNDIYYGADDDGSGTVGVLEIAQAFSEAKKAGKAPRRSILFMTVSGEEKGLWGSAYYASNPIFPLEKTVCDLNIDMIGRVGSEYQKSPDSANYVYIIGDDKLSSALRPISETANNTYTKMKLDYKYNDPSDPNRFYYRSDHYNFAEKGVPIIFYFNGTHADYHKPTDTPDKINYPLLAKRAQLVFYTAWEIANRDAAIPRDQNKP